MDEAWFKARYDADAANATKEPWSKYWDWVQKFYKGTTFPPVKGWADQTKSLLARLDPGVRQAMASRLDDLGRLIASEWAKDNSVRRISTLDLQRWGREFEKAAKSDPGNGSVLGPALEAAEKDVSGRVET